MKVTTVVQNAAFGRNNTANMETMTVGSLMCVAPSVLFMFYAGSLLLSIAKGSPPDLRGD